LALEGEDGLGSLFGYGVLAADFLFPRRHYFPITAMKITNIESSCVEL